ncbi:helix-turn-helix transcriptional regulator [Pedobacter immunditicola]|uniref:helix-turn-helix transcriptional regulator n=1 Tax=Pedobacter immunditicola TaxID=3133440 RepID=UPI0030A512B7
MLISNLEQVSVTRDADTLYQVVRINDGQGLIEFSFSDAVQVLFYVIEGSCLLASAVTDQSFNLKKGEYNLLAFPAACYKIKTKSTSNALVAIVMKAEFIEKYLSPLNLKCADPAEFAPVCSCNLLIDVKSSGVLHDIVNCAFENYLRSLYLKAKVIELFSLYVVQRSVNEKDDVHSLKAAEVEKIAFVKKYIDEHPESPVNLDQLAKMAGTNVQYLKKHFKLLNDTTVLSYIISKRMAYAKKLLETGDYKIAEVAYKSGYKQASYFSSAFKKHFGYLPQRIKSLAEENDKT